LQEGRYISLREKIYEYIKKKLSCFEGKIKVKNKRYWEKLLNMLTWLYYDVKKNFLLTKKKRSSQ